jgi:hypothetical protein
LAAWFGSLLNGGQMFPVIDSGIRNSDCTFHGESWQPGIFCQQCSGGFNPTSGNEESMYIRNLVGVTAKILVAALAITLPVSAYDNSSRKFKVTTHDDRGDRSQVVVYSDSLADSGNIYKLFGVPGPPYWHGRWSNGPVAIEDMASILGMPLLDYAYAAATTGLGNLIDGGTPEQLGSLGLPGSRLLITPRSGPSRTTGFATRSLSSMVDSTTSSVTDLQPPQPTTQSRISSPSWPIYRKEAPVGSWCQACSTWA